MTYEKLRGPGRTVAGVLPIRGAPRLLRRHEERMVDMTNGATSSGRPAGVSPVRGYAWIPGSDAPVRGREAGCEAGRSDRAVCNVSEA